MEQLESIYLFLKPLRAVYTVEVLVEVHKIFLGGF
jgi:hypothetical protein